MAWVFLCVVMGEAVAGCSLPLDGIAVFPDVFMGEQRCARNDLPFAMRDRIQVGYMSTLKQWLINFNRVTL